MGLIQSILGKKQPDEIKQRAEHYVELEKRLKEINVPLHEEQEDKEIMWIHFNWPGDNKGYDLNKEIDAVISVVEEVAKKYNMEPMMQKPHLAAGGVYRMLVRLDKKPEEQVA